MPAGFRCHLVGKTLRNVCYSAVTEICFVCRLADHVDIFWLDFCFNNVVNLHLLTPHTKLYPQNGERIVTIVARAVVGGSAMA